MLSSKQVFTELFPNENVERVFSGSLRYDMTKINSQLNNFPFEKSVAFQPHSSCKVIVGQKHVFIDTRFIIFFNFKIFLLVLSIILPITIYFAHTFDKPLLLVASACIIMPIIVTSLLAYFSAYIGGADSLLLDRSLVKVTHDNKKVIIEGTVPGGNPIFLGQYLAMNNIVINNFWSGEAAWLGSEIPWHFVDTEISLSITSSSGSHKITFLIVFVVIVVLLLATIIMLNNFLEMLKSIFAFEPLS